MIRSSPEKRPRRLRFWLLSVLGLSVCLLLAEIGYQFRALFREPVVVLVAAENSPYHSGYVSEDGDGNFTGSDIALAKSVADRLGRRLEIRNATIGSIFDRLESGEGDFAISMLSITAERERRFLVSRPYDTQGCAFLYRRDRPMPTLATAKEYRIAVVEGTTAADFLMGHGIPVSSQPSFAAAKDAFAAEEADALFYDLPPLKALARSSNEAMTVGPVQYYESYGIFVRRDRPDVLAAANFVVDERFVEPGAHRTYWLLLLAPALGVVAVLVPLVIIKRLLAGKSGQTSIGTIHALSILLVASGVVLMLFVSGWIVVKYRLLLAEARESASEAVDESLFRLENHLDSFKRLAERGRDTLQFVGEGRDIDYINRLLADMSRVPLRDRHEFTGYYGAYAGQYVSCDFGGVGVPWTPPVGYDVKVQEWYRAAQDAPDQVITLPPYVDAATRRIVLTYAMLLENGSDCICVDVILDGLADVLSRFPQASGETYVFTQSGDVLVRPDSSSRISNAMSRLAMHDFFRQACGAATGSGAFTFGGGSSGTLKGYARQLDCGIVVVRVFNEDELIGSYIWRFALASFIGLALLTLVCALSVLLWRRMMRLNRETAEATRRELEAVHKSEQARRYFFSTVSHDIRTPLNAILGYTELLKRGIDDSTEREQALDTIVASGTTLKELVNDVLDLSRLESGKMEIVLEPTDVPDLVRRTVGAFDLTCRKKGLDLVCEIGAMPLLKLDPQRIRQELFNLLGNAVKFTEKGRVAVKADWTNGCFLLSVSDTGPGISEEDQRHLMRPYVQTQGGARHGGTGLGLAICKQLAERMGGRLTLSSELGRGSVFTLAIPDVNAADAPVHVETDAVPTNPPVVRRVLVVDDSPVNLKVLSAMLRRLKVQEIVCAVNGCEALERQRECPADLVLTDLWMPEMDGAQFVKTLRIEEREKGIPTVPVYAVTADVEAQKGDVQAAFTGVILKPVSLVSLSSILGSP